MIRTLSQFKLQLEFCSPATAHHIALHQCKSVSLATSSGHSHQVDITHTKHMYSAGWRLNSVQCAVEEYYNEWEANTLSCAMTVNIFNVDPFIMLKSDTISIFISSCNNVQCSMFSAISTQHTSSTTLSQSKGCLLGVKCSKWRPQQSHLWFH